MRGAGGIGRAALLAALLGASGPAGAQQAGAATAPDAAAAAGQPAGVTQGGQGGGIAFKRAPFRTLGPQEPDLIESVETVARPGAVLRRLDKMTGASETFTLTAGAREDGGRLVVALAACVSPPDNRVEGTRAHLTVIDRARGEAPVFAGWMFADSPALSALDHPRFDVWVISCTTSEGVAVSGSE